MSTEVLIGLIIATLVATASVVVVVRRIVARVSFNRVIARFERELVSPAPSWLPNETETDERTVGRND